MFACALVLAEYDKSDQVLGKMGAGLRQFCEFHLEEDKLEFHLENNAEAQTIDWDSWMQAGLVLARCFCHVPKQQFDAFLQLLKKDLDRKQNPLVKKVLWDYIKKSSHIAIEYTKLLAKQR
jgi:hypothetical protein